MYAQIDNSILTLICVILMLHVIFIPGALTKEYV